MIGWKKREIKGPSKEHEDYRIAMAEIKKRFEKVELKGQVESTSKILALSDADSAKRREELTDLGFWKSLEDKSRAKIWTEEEMWERGAKVYGIKTLIQYEQMRQSSKNSDGQSEKSAFSEERQEAARQAYISTPPAPIDPLKEPQKIEIVKELTIKKIKEKEELLSSSKKKWIFFKRKLGIANLPEKMSYMELQKYWETLNED